MSMHSNVPAQTYTLFCFCDLDLDPMTLIYEFNLIILKACPHTESEVSSSRLSKVRARIGQTYKHTNKQTDRRDRAH